MLSREDVLKMLNKEIEKEGSQVNFARKYKMSNSYVHDVLVQRNRVLGKKVLKALGLERVDSYRRIAKKR
jgi:molybdenum-dependent DNA-binding transcriptional regulator ModE